MNVQNNREEHQLALRTKKKEFGELNKNSTKYVSTQVEGFIIGIIIASLYLSPCQALKDYTN
jgi:tetrahydromethanopterin S-methyltransferase subunit F